MFTVRSKKQQPLLLVAAFMLIVLAFLSLAIAKEEPTEAEELLFIQATLIAARLDQPGLPRYQLSEKELEAVTESFGGLSGLSAKFLQALPMYPTSMNKADASGQVKKVSGWVISLNENWNVLFQIERIDRTARQPIYMTWPPIGFRKGKIIFLEDGLQISDGLEAKVLKHLFIFNKDKGWIADKEAK